MAASTRDTYKYRFCNPRGEQLHCGITNDLHRREGEHRRRFKEPDGYIEQVGRRSTRTSAAAWERDQRCSPYDREVAPRSRKPQRVTVPRHRRESSVGNAVEGFLQGAAVVGGVVLAGTLLTALLGKRSPP